MQLGIWMLAFVAIAVWSLVAWIGHGLLDWTTDWAADNADKVSSVPQIVEWLSWGLRGLGNASEIIVLIVWAVGSILIIAAAGLANRFLAGRQAKFADLRKWRG